MKNESILLYKNVNYTPTKLFFPEIIMNKMLWKNGTLLRVKSNNTSIILQSDMANILGTTKIIKRRYYKFSMVSIHGWISIKIKDTQPVECSYVIQTSSIPLKLSIMIPNHLIKRI